MDFGTFHPMSQPTLPRPRRVIIASANPLFREGLRKTYATQWGERAVIVGTPATMEETLTALETLQPDLMIVDYDDKTINRDEFLSRFLTGESPMRVVLVSLGSTEPVVIYHRERLTSAQADAWLSDPWK